MSGHRITSEMLINACTIVFVVFISLFCIAATWMNLWGKYKYRDKISEYDPELDLHEHTRE